jgi:hypothetical protein
VGTTGRPSLPAAHPAASQPVGDRPQLVVALNDRLHLPTGGTIALPSRTAGAPEWSTVAPVSGGWVVGNGYRLVLVRQDGGFTDLANENPAGTIPTVFGVPSPDGGRIAVYDQPTEGQGTVQVVDARTLHEIGRTSTGDVSPYRWFGTQLILAESSAETAGPRRVSLWNPANGGWDHKLSTQPVALAGATADGTAMVGYTVTIGSQVCLGLVRPAADFAFSGAKCQGADDVAYAQLSGSRTQLAIGILKNNKVTNQVSSLSGAGRVTGTRSLKAADVDADQAVWESERTYDLFIAASDPNPDNIYVTRCRLDTGECARVPTAAVGTGMAAIAALAPPRGR